MFDFNFGNMSRTQIDIDNFISTFFFSSSKCSSLISHLQHTINSKHTVAQICSCVTFFFHLPLQEIDFMYKPGNLSTPPPVVTPHQPRLDWQMWFAALGSSSQAPWFTSLMYRLLQGKIDGRDSSENLREDALIEHSAISRKCN